MFAFVVFVFLDVVGSGLALAALGLYYFRFSVCVGLNSGCLFWDCVCGVCVVFDACCVCLRVFVWW